MPGIRLSRAGYWKFFVDTPTVTTDRNGSMVEIEDESHCIHLLVRTLARVALVLIIRIKFDVLAHGEQAACIKRTHR